VAGLLQRTAAVTCRDQLFDKDRATWWLTRPNPAAIDLVIGECPLMALSGHARLSSLTSAFDPKQTYEFFLIGPSCTKNEGGTERD